MCLGSRSTTSHEIHGPKPVRHYWKVAQSSVRILKWWKKKQTCVQMEYWMCAGCDRYQSITDLVKSWHEERHHFSYPSRCSGSVCSHYTQVRSAWIQSIIAFKESLEKLNVPNDRCLNSRSQWSFTIPPSPKTHTSINIDRLNRKWTSPLQ